MDKYRIIKIYNTVLYFRSAYAYDNIYKRGKVCVGKNGKDILEQEKLEIPSIISS